MTKYLQEKKKTHELLLDFCSTLDEISIYLSKNDPFYKLVKISAVGGFSVDLIYEKVLFIRQQIEINFLIEKEYSEEFYKRLKDFIFSELVLLMDIMTLFFNKLLILVIDKNNHDDPEGGINPVKLFGVSYFVLNLSFKSLKNIVNRYFYLGFKEHTELRVIDDSGPVWSIKGMKYKELKSDISKIQSYAQDVLKDSSISDAKDMILQLQISEFIKNAIRHGNLLNKDKKVKIWYDINNDYAKLIIEDEGEGFSDLNKWNEFNKKRLQYIERQDIQNVLKYAVYKTEKSIENDGGNFLFSALEYWDSGLIYNTKKNKLYVMKYFY